MMASDEEVDVGYPAEASTGDRPPVGRWIDGHWTCGTVIGFDLETTGVDVFGDLPVSYALVTYRDRRPVRWDTAIIDCGRDSAPGAEAKHGITRARALDEGISLEEATQRMVGVITRAGRDGVPVVGMNISFDLTMVDSIIRRSGGPGLAGLGWEGPAVDCAVLDRHVDRYRRGKRQLSDLCVQYGVTHRGAHEAVADVEAAVEVTILLCQGSDELLGLDLPTLTARQVQWRHDQTADLSAYRTRNGQPAIPPHEHRWPVMPAPGSAG